jgi:uncharacterized protein (TIGR00725 family)
VHPAVRYVAVIGKGRDCPAWVRALAWETGQALARLRPHVVLVNGGLGGVMDASAGGMTTSGGVAIGLVPSPGRAPSKHLTYAIRLGLPVLFRDIITAQAAELVAVLPGSHGTMIEGWAAAERGLPMIRVGGKHEGWPTADLPIEHHADPAELAPLVARLLGIPALGWPRANPSPVCLPGSPVHPRPPVPRPPDTVGRGAARAEDAARLAGHAAAGARPGRAHLRRLPWAGGRGPPPAARGGGRRVAGLPLLSLSPGPHPRPGRGRPRSR